MDIGLEEGVIGGSLVLTGVAIVLMYIGDKKHKKKNMRAINEIMISSDIMVNRLSTLSTLARTMTLRNAMAKLPYGGAASGITFGSSITMKKDEIFPREGDRVKVFLSYSSIDKEIVGKIKIVF